MLCYVPAVSETRADADESVLLYIHHVYITPVKWCKNRSKEKFRVYIRT